MTTDVDRLMKRCQVGVGGRRALDEAHDILAECYGTLGRQQIEIERLRAELAEMTADRDSWADQASQRTQDAVDLVAKERERCAKLCEDSCAYTGGHGEPSRPSGPRRTTMTDTTHADSERNQPLGLASTDLLGLVERLRAELAAEEACARLHAGLLREVAAAIGNDPCDDRSTLPERVRAMRSELDRCGKDNCMGRKAHSTTTWVTLESREHAIRRALDERDQVHAESSRIYARLASAVRAGADDATLGRLLRAEVDGSPNAELRGRPARGGPAPTPC